MFHVEQKAKAERKQCPICGSEEKTLFLSSIDYSCSKEGFDIQECNECHFRYTSPVPHEENIGAYYESDLYISHTDSKKGLINKVYQKVRKHAIKQKFELVKRLAKGESLLDIGCGTGDFLKYVKEQNWKVKGLEPDQGARSICERKGLEVEHTNQLHDLEEHAFSIITMWHVLEHVYDLNNDFRQIKQLLQSDGRLIIAVPNCSSYDAKKYGKHWAAYDLPIHLYHFRPNDIRNLANKYDMDVEEILPMKFDSYYVSLLSEKFKGGNAVKAFFSGWKSNRKAKKNPETWSSQIYVLKNR